MHKLVGLFVFGAVFFMAAPGWGLEKPESVQQTAQAFFEALRQGQVDKAGVHGLSYAEWAAMSKRGLEQKTFERKQAQFLKELGTVLSRGGKISEVVLKDVLVLPAGEKLKRNVTMAIFHGTLFMPGRDKRGQTLVFCFLQVDGRWRFWHRG